MRLAIFAVLAGIMTILPGCAISHGPDGLVCKAIPWHLHDGSYRPWNDVNSGSLQRWNSWGSIYGGGSSQSSFERGNLVRY
jgi:hypothetical protein